MLATIFQKLLQLYLQKRMRWQKQPCLTQEKTLKKLIFQAKDTDFGKAHDFSNITDHADFVARVPLRKYEDFLPYIERILEGEENILWSHQPLYLAKTSGTTAAVKYIPITAQSLPNHINAAKYALLHYLKNTGNFSILKGKMMFLQGNPQLEKKNGIKVGRLSGIVAHHVPWYLQAFRLPSWQNNCITLWEEKVDAIVAETIPKDLRVLGGIPIWLLQYFEKLLAKTGKQNILEIFPHFSLLMYGGVNYLPYQNKINSFLGKKIDSVELYPASEGFFAYQDSLQSDDLLLLLDQNIFYEFVPLAEITKTTPTRLTLAQVQIGVDYALVISSNAGLWGYVIGDTIKFTQTFPHKIKISGRITQYISAFGEHVIMQEVETALRKVAEKFGLKISEFTVAPHVTPSQGKPHHEWWIEWAEPLPVALPIIEQELDAQMQAQNIYYKDLITGNILTTLKIRSLPAHSFERMMKSLNKLGEQNKVPHLANHREYADLLSTFL